MLVFATRYAGGGRSEIITCISYVLFQHIASRSLYVGNYISVCEVTVFECFECIINYQFKCSCCIGVIKVAISIVVQNFFG